MLLKCKCPGCGEIKEYIAEQVGSELDCFRCGRRLVLKSNKLRATWPIVSAVFAVFVFAGALAAWYHESRKWERFDERTTQDESYLFEGSPENNQ